MNEKNWARWLGLAVATLLTALPLAAAADPPSRAIRLSYASADASFSPAGSEEWVAARINRPLWIGDRVWSANGNVELQIGGASLRLAPRTALTVLNFDDRLAQFELTQGTVALNARAIDDREDTIEIDTPSLAFVVRTEGDFRVDVDRDETAVSVRRGWAEVWGAGNVFRVDRREKFVFHDDELRDYEVRALPPPDGFERWARERARREDVAVSSRYVSPELVGYVDLDAYGEWRTERDYGAVWYPRVEATWAPYRHGHWAWIDPWGWTWIDEAPWGFAPFHYGRWAQVGARWGWVPGPREVRPVYAPALVAWVGGDNFSLAIAGGRSRGVAWFPLAPGEIWRPAYDVSREYFTRVNVSNTYVQQTTVVNVYNDYRRGGAVQRDYYRYRAIPAAVTVVPVETFVQSRPVHRNVVNVNVTQVVQQSSVATAPHVRPVVQSFMGGGARAEARPPAETLRRTVVAREAPPAAVPTLQDRVNMVRERDGRPIDRQAFDQVRPASAPAQASPAGRAPAEQARQGQRGGTNDLRSGVRVVGNQNAQPTALPPPGVAQSPRGPVQNVPPAAAQPGDDAARARSNETRRDAERRGGEATTRPGTDAPVATPPSPARPTPVPSAGPTAAPPAATPPAAAGRATPPTERGSAATPGNERSAPPGQARPGNASRGPAEKEPARTGGPEPRSPPPATRAPSEPRGPGPDRANGNDVPQRGNAGRERPSAAPGAAPPVAPAARSAEPPRGPNGRDGAPERWRSEGDRGSAPAAAARPPEAPKAPVAPPPAARPPEPARAPAASPPPAEARGPARDRGNGSAAVPGGGRPAPSAAPAPSAPPPAAQGGANGRGAPPGSKGRDRDEDEAEDRPKGERAKGGEGR